MINNNPMLQQMMANNPQAREVLFLHENSLKIRVDDAESRSNEKHDVYDDESSKLECFTSNATSNESTSKFWIVRNDGVSVHIVHAIRFFEIFHTLFIHFSPN